MVSHHFFTSPWLVAEKLHANCIRPLSWGYQRSIAALRLWLVLLWTGGGGCGAQGVKYADICLGLVSWPLHALRCASAQVRDEQTYKVGSSSLQKYWQKESVIRAVISVLLTAWWAMNCTMYNNREPGQKQRWALIPEWKGTDYSFRWALFALALWLITKRRGLSRTQGTVYTFTPLPGRNSWPKWRWQTSCWLLVKLSIFFKAEKIINFWQPRESLIALLNP